MTFAETKCDEEIEEAKAEQQSLDQTNTQTLEANGHVSTVDAFLSNLPIFEALLDNSVLKMSGRRVMKWLNENKIMHLLSNGDTYGIRDADHWDNKRESRKIWTLADLAYQLLKVGSKQCYYCTYTQVGRDKTGHLDHLPLYYTYKHPSAMIN